MRRYFLVEGADHFLLSGMPLHPLEYPDALNSIRGTAL